MQVTFYDRHAFVRPVSAVYAFRRAKDLEAAGHRVQHWECETSNNDVFDNGTTTREYTIAARAINPTKYEGSANSCGR